MNKNKILYIIISILVIGSIIFIGYRVYKNDLKNDDENIKKYDVYNYLSKDIVDNAQTNVISTSFATSSDPEEIIKRADLVVLASIISIDGVNPEINSAVGATYGNLVINNVLYGEINEGAELEFIKAGAIMSLAEWDSAQLQGSREKRAELRKEAGIDDSYMENTYHAYHYANDPIIEEGKTYLLYLKYNDSVDKYEIIGRENGSRELDIEKTNKVTNKKYNLKDYKILNNVSGKYESLNNYVQKYVVVS